ncbi:MAG: N-acetylmuramoyl-L-alanine amidase [Rickettsiales bacterium]|nr:N-acetylmuramoyl-L-alanine amidase [Rickettsiales bacterium]
MVSNRLEAAVTRELNGYLVKAIEELAGVVGAEAGDDPESTDANNLVDTIVDLLLLNDNDTPETLDDVITKSVRARDVDDLIALNNIVNDRKMAEDLEKQNNDELKLDNILEKIAFQKVDYKRSPKEKKGLGLFIRKGYFVVVLDAGHGGIDSGAVGTMGSREKEINLEFTKMLGRELKKNKKIKVYLSRHSDKYLSISERITKTRELGANLLISIHSDSNTDRTVRGLTVYTLAKSALDMRRRKVANNLIGQNGRRTLKSGLFGTIRDVLRHDNFDESVEFAGTLVQNFGRGNINMLSRAHRSANFGILLASEFPSVLIELGFISNPGDEALLRSEKYKVDLAKYIARSVDTHFLAGL